MTEPVTNEAKTFNVDSMIIHGDVAGAHAGCHSK